MGRQHSQCVVIYIIWFANAANFGRVAWSHTLSRVVVSLTRLYTDIYIYKINLHDYTLTLVLDFFGLLNFGQASLSVVLCLTDVFRHH